MAVRKYHSTSPACGHEEASHKTKKMSANIDRVTFYVFTRRVVNGGMQQPLHAPRYPSHKISTKAHNISFHFLSLSLSSCSCSSNKILFMTYETLNSNDTLLAHHEQPRFPLSLTYQLSSASQHCHAASFVALELTPVQRCSCLPSAYRPMTIVH